MFYNSTSHRQPTSIIVIPAIAMTAFAVEKVLIEPLRDNSIFEGFGSSAGFGIPLGLREAI
jgi:hypothetical protein